MSCFPNSSSFLEFCLAVFQFEVASSPPVFTSCLQVGDTFHLTCLYLGLSLTLQGYTWFTFLAPSCGQILKLVCLLSTLQDTRLAVVNLVFVFLKVKLELKIVVFPLPADIGLFSVHTPCLPDLTFSATLGACITSWLQSGGRVGLAFRALGVTMGQVGDSPLRFSQRLRGGLPAKVRILLLFWVSETALYQCTSHSRGVKHLLVHPYFSKLQLLLFYSTCSFKITFSSDSTLPPISGLFLLCTTFNCLQK